MPSENTNNSIMDQKIQQNESERNAFEKELHALLNGDKKIASKPLTVGVTTNALAICGADKNIQLTITKKVIDKAMRPELKDENGKRAKKSGHFLSEQQIAEALDNLKKPVMIIEGSKDNTIVAVTEIKDDKGQQIIVPIELNKSSSIDNVNNITSIYGREGFAEYIKNNIRDNNIIAVNTEKANEMFLSIGVDFPKANTLISFDNSISYTDENVKTLSDFFAEELLSDEEDKQMPIYFAKEFPDTQIEIVKQLPYGTVLRCEPPIVENMEYLVATLPAIEAETISWERAIMYESQQLAEANYSKYEHSYKYAYLDCIAENLDAALKESPDPAEVLRTASENKKMDDIRTAVALYICTNRHNSDIDSKAKEWASDYLKDTDMNGTELNFHSKAEAVKWSSLALKLYEEQHPSIDIVIDTETTGLNPYENELLQVSIVKTDGTVLYNEYVKPTKATSWDSAEAVNHISPSDVANSKTIEEQLPEINRILAQSKSVIGYNTPFDMSFLSSSGAAFRDDVNVIDVMRDYSERHGEWDNDKGRYKWIKLIECAEHYGYEWNSHEGQAHNSLSDCFATLYCFNKLQEENRTLAETAQLKIGRSGTGAASPVRLFVDMDGTLARFHDEVQYLERMWEKDFFTNLKPFQELVDGLKEFKQRNPNVEVFILSAAIEGEPPYCKAQKHKWLEEHLSEIDAAHRIFTDVGVPKANYIAGGIRSTDILIDDYNVGLEEWQKFGGTAVKCVNNINHKGLHGKLWEGELIKNSDSPSKICSDLEQLVDKHGTPPVKKAIQQKGRKK